MMVLPDRTQFLRCKCLKHHIGQVFMVRALSGAGTILLPPTTIVPLWAVPCQHVMTHALGRWQNE